MRQRGDAWQLRVYLGRDPVTGKQILETRTVRGGKRDAQRELAKLIAQAERGRSVGSDATVADLVSRWIETAAPDWSQSTRRQHESAIRRHINPLLGQRRLRTLSASDLDWFYGELRKLPGRGANDTMAPATIRRIYVILRAALEQAVKWGWIPANPAVGSSPPKVRQAKIEPPDAAAVGALLRMIEAEDRAFSAFIRMAASTGARRSQLCGLQWRDVDFSTGQIIFARGVVDDDQGIAIKSTKSDRAYRVSVDGATLQVLEEHRFEADRLATECQTDIAPPGSSSRIRSTGPSRGGPTVSHIGGPAGDRRRGSKASDCTTFGTSWQRRC